MKTQRRRLSKKRKKKHIPINVMGSQIQGHTFAKNYGRNGE
jgi:hypothetical protein